MTLHYLFTDHLISQTIHAATFLAYEELNANILEACSYDRNAASKPIKVQNFRLKNNMLNIH